MPNADDVRIGDFDKPLTKKPEAPASPTRDALVDAESRLDAEAQRDEAVIKPMVDYEARLKEAEITKEKAAEIVDAVLTRGFYSEVMNITSRIKVRLRTRTARDTRRAQEILEAQRFTIDSHYQEMLSRLLLAASLEQFGEDKFEHPDVRKKATMDAVEKAFQSRMDYVDTLPDPALRVLFNKLYKFDNKVAVALTEGAIENF